MLRRELRDHLSEQIALKGSSVASDYRKILPIADRQPSRPSKRGYTQELKGFSG